MIKVKPIIYFLLLSTAATGESTGKGQPGRLRTQDIEHGRALKGKNTKAAKVCVLHVQNSILLIHDCTNLSSTHTVNFHPIGRSWKGETMPQR